MNVDTWEHDGEGRLSVILLSPDKLGIRPDLQKEFRELTRIAENNHIGRNIEDSQDPDMLRMIDIGNQSGRSVPEAFWKQFGEVVAFKSEVNGILDKKWMPKAIVDRQLDKACREKTRWGWKQEDLNGLIQEVRDWRSEKDQKPKE